MNSGCYDNDISKVLLSIKAIDKDKCSEIEIKKADIKFFYRGNDLPDNLIIISAKLKGSINKKDAIEQKQLDLINRKKYPNQVKLKHVGVLLKMLTKIKRPGC